MADVIVIVLACFFAFTSVVSFSLGFLLSSAVRGNIASR